GFIYGFNASKNIVNETSFIPIDGQQRLTTLWLLYWFVSVKEMVEVSERKFLSNFLYETRHSTTEFCKNLIKLSPKFEDINIVKEIINQPWYFETWDYDPSVKAMLVVLGDIEERYQQLQISNIWKLIEGKSCPFYFYKLDMEKVGLTDDLYIKMNSRGKGLTDFEYFKAGFSEILEGQSSRERFENSIDQHWIDAIWNLVLKSNDYNEEDDVALVVDDCFLNLFNYITSVIAFQKDIQTEEGSRYKDTEISGDLIKSIYKETENQNILFDTLDAICEQQNSFLEFWELTFYFDKLKFNSNKARLYFQHLDASLLERCLFYFGSRAFTYPEQLLLHCCLIHLRFKTDNFEKRIRVIRNLVTNSSNELREINLGYSFNEVENYILNGDLAVFKYFNSDQIEEEINKENSICVNFEDIDVLHRLEDSELFRGSISIFPFDQSFRVRALKFLEIFDEDEICHNGLHKGNLLLCFGDYTQDDNQLTNIMGSTQETVRSFLTTPSYNKKDLYLKTRLVLLDCLDFFIANKPVSLSNKIKEVLNDYRTKEKDWIYYFIMYPSFRENCHQGYFKWFNEDYCAWKLSKKQLNGYHWDPFLHEIVKRFNSSKLTLGNYGTYDKLMLVINRKKILISSHPNGFLFENGMSNGANNTLFDELIAERSIKKNGALIIKQDEQGYDLEDRIKKLTKIIENYLSN
ncbi:DUF262 domain-containing protein, partial [bacterium]